MVSSSPEELQAEHDELQRREEALAVREQQLSDRSQLNDDSAGNAALNREFVADIPGTRRSGRNPWVLLSILVLCAGAMYFVITNDSRKASRAKEMTAAFEVTKPRARIVPGKDKELAPMPTAETEQFNPEPPSPTREEMERRKELEEKRKQAEALKLARLKSAILVAGGHGSLFAGAPSSIAAPNIAATVPGDESLDPVAPWASGDGAPATSLNSAFTATYPDSIATYPSSSGTVRAEARDDASSRDPNDGFFAEKSGRGQLIAQATRLGNLSHTVLQGKLVDCILETAIQSDLPGQLRCVTSNDVYAETGRAVMLPAKTRMIGQYNSAVRKGQVRVFVIWQRAITPDGVDIQLDSPGTDTSGRAGIGGDVDNHYLEIFGVSAMLSIIGAGASSYGVGGADQPNSESAYRQAIQQSFGQTAQQILSPYAQIAPTIHVNQGEAIKIFVNRDLDFIDVYAARVPPKRQSFTVIQ